MVRKFWFFFLVLVIEGASLMAVEIMGAKLLAPFYGSSLYVWTAVLSITLLGLTLGYYFGGQLSTRQTTGKPLILILAIASLLVFALPVSAKALISLTSSIPLIPGIFVASFLLLTPPMLCFGMVGPMVVRLMTQKMEILGNVAGTVYFTSTLGGIMATFLLGFYCIPALGLKFSALITGIALALLPVVYLINTILLNKKEMLAIEVQQVQDVKTRPGASSKSKTPQTRKLKNSVYLFAALEGATVMAVELMAARMLAPYFGSSLFVWVSVIGITLLSLALGYYVGGRLADKYTRMATIHWVLLIASLLLMFMHYFSHQLTLAFADIDMRTALILISVLFVLPPLFFLGMVPTLLIRFLTTKVDHSGITTGRVFTISTASGIIALPIMGFFIIPQFGLTMPSIIIGLLVGTIPFVKLLSHKKYVSLLFVLFLLISVSQRNRFTKSADVKVLTYSEGLLGQVLVADVFKNGIGNEINDRMLFINRMGQTLIDKSSNRSKWNYIIFASAVASVIPENSKALILGLGGGSVANVLQNNLKFNVDAIELDKRIAKAAGKYFSLNPNVNVIVDDARHFLGKTDQTYDLIFFDVFNGDVQPPHVLSLECFEKAKSLLNKNGLIIVNFNGFLSGENGKSGRSVYTTLHAAGLGVKILPTPGKENERNTLFVASAETMDYNQLRFPLLHRGKLVDLDSLFLNTNTLNLKDAMVFTDDKPALDKLNSKANNIWRKGYNETYTRFFLDNGIPLFN